MTVTRHNCQKQLMNYKLLNNMNKTTIYTDCIAFKLVLVFYSLMEWYMTVSKFMTD